VKLEDAIQLLVGKPMVEVYRFLPSLYSWEFGELIQYQSRITGKTFLDSELHLHTENVWRFEDNHRIVVAWHDFFYWAEGKKRDQYDPTLRDKRGKSRGDVLIGRICKQLPARTFTVSEVAMDNLGGLRVSFVNGWKLVIFLTTSSPEEAWRLMDGRSRKHYVCNIPCRKRGLVLTGSK